MTRAIIRALKVLLEPNQVTELRALGVSTPEHRHPHTVSGYFDNIETLAASAAKLDSAQGVYFVLNPINAALLARANNRARSIADREPLTTDSDILCRRWLSINAGWLSVMCRSRNGCE